MHTASAIISNESRKMKDFVYYSSNFMLKVIDGILQTNINVHGTENLTEGSPTLFVSNHFTRFETLVMPYVINKYTGVQIRSLADKSIFIGLLKHYLELSGSLSTADPHRNEIIIGDLMSGRRNWLIYPEGNMIKNKKITKDDEFIMHTPTRTGGIFTGAAMLALKSQLLKSEFRAAQRSGDQQNVQECRAAYFLEEDERVSYKSTVIIPVSLTYYPIRTGFNPMMSMASLLANGSVSEKVMEELEIEGNILTSSEIHVRFGKPIDMAHYIHDAKRIMMTQGEHDTKKIHNRILQEHRHILTTIFMDSVYKNTMITFDHLFAAVLDHYPGTEITGDQLKRAIFLSARDVRALGTYHTHEEINEKLISMLTDEGHVPFDSAMRFALEQGIITETKHETYRIERGVFNNNHTFHDIRIKNTFRVIFNEIALLDVMHTCIEEIVQKDPYKIVEDTFYSIYRLDREIYKNDYNTFYSVIGSKPKEVGEPFILYNPEFTTGIVFSHGFDAAPEEVRPLAEYLHDNGFNVYAIRLKGHGTMPEDLRDTTHEAWLDSFNRGYAALRQVCRHIFVGGFSAGGLVALLAASRKMERIDGVVCINTALKLNDIRIHAVPTLNAFNDFLSVFDADLEYIESEPENPYINYARNYLSSISELRELMKLVHAQLKNITVPVLIIQGDRDPTVNPEGGKLIAEKISSETKELFMPAFSRHVIIAGEGSKKVSEKVSGFMRRVVLKQPRRRETD
jgi:esterase/lipase/1-acyl-sn-glycerol-3-phosphate acyltransferase